MISEEDRLIKDRIRFLLTKKHSSINKISNDDNERIRLGRQINGEDTLVTYYVIRKILYTFPDISADWLVMGEGSMWKAEHVAPHVFTQNNNVHDNRAGGDINVGSGTQVVPSQQKFDEMQARIAELERDKRTLQAVVDAMTAGVKK